MQKKAIVFKQVLGFSILTLSSYVTTLFLALFLSPAPLANALGFVSLLAYIATLMPSMFRTVFPATKGSKVLVWLLKHRRYVGVTAFGLGLDHGIILIIQRKLSLLDPYTYVEYFQGVSILVIFTLLAITSNDWSIKKLKNNWKNLQKLTYLVVFLLPWHILGKMSGHWSYLTPFAVLLSTGLAILFIQRKWIELR